MSEFNNSKSGDHGSSDLLVLERLKQRKDFLRLAHAKRVHSTSFVLQARDRGEEPLLRVGLTYGFWLTLSVNAILFPGFVIGSRTARL